MTSTIKILKPLEYADEKNGFISLKTDFGDHITNYTGKFLIDSLYDQMPLQLLIQKYQKKHIITEKAAKIDVGEFLSCLKIMGFVDYSDEIFTDVFSGTKFNIAGEIDYEQIAQKINQNLKREGNTWFNGFKDDRRYSPYLIRAKGFNNHENYFYLRDENFEVTAIIGVSNISETNSPVNIILIQTSGSKESVYDLYEFIESELSRLKKHKIRIMTPKDADTIVFDFIRKFDFFKEGELVKEDNYNDYFIFSKLL